MHRDTITMKIHITIRNCLGKYKIHNEKERLK